jgi:glycosyltransferase involved in cell wall biosynthesis
MRAPIRVLELRSVRGTGGGPEKTILYGAARADAHRFAVTVCYLRDARDDVFGIDARARDLPIDYVEIPERHSFDPRVWPRLLQTMRERRIDIVHAHEYKTDAYALALARAAGAKPLATAHGWTGHSARERRFYYPVDRQLLRWYPRVIAVSSEIRDTLARSGVRADRIVTLPNGIDAAAFRRDRRAEAAVRAELGIEADGVAIGSVGRLEPQKRFDILIDAVAALRLERRVQLFIVGDGSQREQLEQHARARGIQAACHLLGHRADIARLHHAFDVYVQSSDYEGTPNTVLEAMALETPIVTTSAGGTRDVVRDGVDGLIVPCGDAAAIARAIERTLGDPGCARARVAAARRRVERELSFDHRTRTLEQIYERLVYFRS